MRKHTWKSSTDIHRETREEYINRFKRTLVDQCLAASRMEHINIFSLFYLIDAELLDRGYEGITEREEKELRHLLLGCGFTNNENKFTFWK